MADFEYSKLFWDYSIRAGTSTRLDSDRQNSRVETKEKEKIEKYQDLQIEIRSI